jgi:ATP/maltotriose-dependent transcriptional regulator MalT
METFLQLRTPGPEAYAWQSRMEAEYLRFFQRIGRSRSSTAELVAAWEESVQLFLDYPHVFELARSRTRLAEALLIGDHDRKRAEELLAQAAEVATRLGARPLLAEIADLRGRSNRRSARTAPSQSGPSNPLTLREREVLDLVAEGLSNRDIGTRLVISTKTASVHVSNIMAKLGAESRTEAVAIARRNGILT